MKANELRIGNWAHFDNRMGMSYDYQVTPQYFRQLGFDLSDNLDLELNGFHTPIPLTPEVLEKCNATKNHRYNTYMFEQFCVHEENGEFHLMNNEYSNASCYHICNVKYLHQLQNQIFSLSGKELTYKP